MNKPTTILITLSILMSFFAYTAFNPIFAKPSNPNPKEVVCNADTFYATDDEAFNLDPRGNDVTKNRKTYFVSEVNGQMIAYSPNTITEINLCYFFS